ncbi:uncharacterized protein K02A2.6-like [Lutzomyia longipalpis]|uniref:uncharacterized protein K02A2.6-like n=1 Tax=Lutzomyia longipalpis TaxID=7200 RepID=UPI002483B9E9|nr:uncharacterized protein K02A2.6-like [Lutzomyia longipalpis]
MSNHEIFAELTDAINRMIDMRLSGAVKTEGHGASEVSVDALARSITPFTYAPENNMTFDVWYGRYKSTFLEDGRNLDDPGRVRLLLRRLDNAAYARYSNLLRPVDPATIPFDDTVQRLTKLFGKGESLFSTRRKCLQFVMKESVDWATHGGLVNSICEDFRLAECTADQFKALIFCISIQSDKHIFVREQLLTRLETEPADRINVEFLIDEAQRLSNMKKDARLDITPANVSALQKTRKSTNSQSDRPSRPCYLCGDMHWVRDCTHTNTKCKDCGKIGHKSGYCPPQRTQDNGGSTGKGKKKFFKKKKSSANTNVVYAPHPRGRKFLTPRINGRLIEFQLDCAADVSLVSRSTWEELGKPLLRESSMNVTDAQSNRMPILGEFDCDVVLRGKKIRGRCMVVGGRTSNLFGIEWIAELGLWDVAPSAYCHAVQGEFDTASAVKEIRESFPGVFGREIGKCTRITASIHLKPNAKPIFRPKRPVAFHMLPVVDEELQRLQSSGIITPVEYSPWAAPIVVARKSNGTIRICGDYSSGLNESIEMNNYPIPDPDSLFSRLSNKSVFSHIDLSDAYLQVPMDIESSNLLTIHTPRGLFRFNRLPPGIKSAPGIFQEVVERMLQGIPDVICYFDDICVASSSPEAHFSTLKTVFQRLKDFNFRVRLEKYPDKCDAIKRMPAPKNVQELRSFLGAIQFWGKFVKGMSELRKPMDDLLKKNARWKWTQQCQKAFIRFKEILTSDLLLTHYDPHLPITIASDASSHAMGCVAYHEYPDGTLKAFYHASRKMTDAEMGYSQIEKEALGIIFAVKKFHRFIYGRNFTLLTDHKPLLSIFGSKKGIPVHTANRLQRWALILLGYDFTIKYTSTTSFGHADVLSRLINNHRQPDDEVIIAQILDEEYDNVVVQEVTTQLPVNFQMIKDATAASRDLQLLIGYIKGGWPPSQKSIKSREVARYFKIRDALSIIKDCVFYRDRVVVPETFRSKILAQLHEAHPGMSRMKALARSYVFWPGLDEDVETKVRHCSDCATASRSPVKTNLASWPLSTGPWQRIHLDYAKYKGDYFLLVIDAYSKWPEVFRTSSTTTTITIQKLVEVFARHGLPEVIVSDNGTQFVSDEFQEFCRLNGIQHIRTCPYSPASNGQCERLVDTLKRSLEKQSAQKIDTALQRFLANYRVTPNDYAPAGKSPSEVMYGRKVRTIFDLLKERPKEPLQRNEKMERDYNKKHGTKQSSFSKGEEIYAKKFAQGGKWKWVPGKIIERRGTVTYNVRLSDGLIIRSHVNQLKRRFSETPDTPADTSSSDLPIFAPSSVPLLSQVQPQHSPQPESSRRSSASETPVLPQPSRTPQKTPKDPPAEVQSPIAGPSRATPPRVTPPQPSPRMSLQSNPPQSAITISSDTEDSATTPYEDTVTTPERSNAGQSEDVEDNPATPDHSPELERPAPPTPLYRRLRARPYRISERFKNREDRQDEPSAP